VAADDPRAPEHVDPARRLWGISPQPRSELLQVIDVLREQRKHDAVMSLAVGFAVSAEDAFPLKPSLFDRTDRGGVIHCGFSEHATEPKLAQTPHRAEP